ncbi:MAG TPA: hypothetical protein VL359_19535, partial [bacterium]|nr:hypothetical protein [bacterium]
QRLVAGRFVAAYRTPQGILERMQRILVRLGQRRLEPAEQAAAWDELERQAELQRERLHGFIAWAALGFAGAPQARRDAAPARAMPNGVAESHPLSSGQAGPGPGTLHQLGCSPGSGAPLAVMES